jgi:hypothetical protein
MNTPIDEYLRTYDGAKPRDGVTRDIAFNRKSFGEGQPENPDQGNIYVGTDGIKVTLEQDFNDEQLRHLLSYAINATRGIDPNNPPEPADWEEMLKGGLQTSLEDFRIAFAVYGASRTATHQIVRSRRAAFHQQSQRAHYYGDRPSVREPESFVGKPPLVVMDHEDWHGGLYKLASESGARVTDVDAEYKLLAEHAAWFYRFATNKADISYQDARFGLLEGTANFILCEYSLIEFMNVYAYRGCSMFQWEIVCIMRQMRELLVAAHPYLDPYVKISCEKTRGALDADDEFHRLDGSNAHHCTFQGWEHVEPQCDFPWARESNRSFKSQHHEIADRSKS